MSLAMDRSPTPTGSSPIPDLEVVDVSRRSPFKAWAHGYPYRTVRWHFHPEYEIHLVTATSGRSFIGDYIGSFTPGNLVVVGPNLPHNWISEIGKDDVVPRRSIVVQFSGQFIRDCMAVVPELASIEPLLRASARGIEAVNGADPSAKQLFEDMLHAEGAGRIGLFFQLLGVLQKMEFRCLASDRFTPQPEMYANQPLNRVIEHVTHTLGENITQAEMAEISGFTPSAFSRAFKQHTGMTFVRYVNRLRIDRACELLMGSSQSVADICYQVGFNNLSNFNRQFLAIKRMSPSRFRHQRLESTPSRLQNRLSISKAKLPALTEKRAHGSGPSL